MSVLWQIFSKLLSLIIFMLWIICVPYNSEMHLELQLTPSMTTFPLNGSSFFILLQAFCVNLCKLTELIIFIAKVPICSQFTYRSYYYLINIAIEQGIDRSRVLWHLMATSSTAWYVRFEISGYSCQALCFMWTEVVMNVYYNNSFIQVHRHHRQLFTS